MTPNLAVIEAASWRITAMLLRNNPDLHVIRMHPGGGLSDVLCVRSPHGADIWLNRVGTIQAMAREGGNKVAGFRPIEWSDVLLAGPDEIVDRLQGATGLAPAGLSPMTNRDAAVQTMSALAALGAHDRPFTITQGYVESSSGSYESDWWREMTVLAPDETSPQEIDLFLGHPGLRFWRVERDDFCLTFDATTATVWLRHSDHLDLSDPDDLEEARAEAWNDLVDAAGVAGAIAERDILAGTRPQRTDPALPLLRAALELGTEGTWR